MGVSNESRQPVRLCRADGGVDQVYDTRVVQGTVNENAGSVPVVVAWSLVPEENKGIRPKGGKLLCGMEFLIDVQDLDPPVANGTYLVEGLDGAGEPIIISVRF